MPENDITLIKTLLAEKIGANASSLGKNILMQHIRPRMRALGIHDLDVYASLLVESSKELNDFIEHFVVPETWFFREKPALIFLAQYAVKKIKKTLPKTPLRILCLPCSTGEEAYSIVMALFDEGISPSDFVVDAVDISKKSLIKAESLLFGSNSFRDEDLAFRERYFTKKACGYVLDDKVATPIHFMFGNIVDPQFALHKKPYDIIICRNLLIYFNQTAKKRTFHTFDKLLKPDGILILGQAEYDTIRPFPYVSIDAAHQSIYKRKDSSTFFPVPSTRERKEIIALEKEISPPKISSSVSRISGEALLSQAHRLADSGKLEEAEKLSKDYLALHGLDSQAYFLLGIIQHAAGHDINAKEFFEKTLYLDPSHYEALIYLSLLHQKLGENQKAELYRSRASKAAKQKANK